jgi:hypothetical protein
VKDDLKRRVKNRNLQTGRVFEPTAEDHVRPAADAKLRVGEVEEKEWI